ncbi:hypothetical protein C8Q76DRAFT_682066 [Earliella scabrosa]|nr:hypothetical protein C8Q76DRAFT_682066 [Earliella scabrosa]
MAKPTVESILHAACQHYRLGSEGLQDRFVLLGAIEGDELELTDESLKLVPNKAVLTLSRIPEIEPCDSSDVVVEERTKSSVVSKRRTAKVSSDRLEICVYTATGVEVLLLAKPDTKFARVLSHFAKRTGNCAKEWRLKFGEIKIAPEQTLQELNIKDGDRIYAMLEQVGGKPVIYLFPPEPLPSATVSVRLVPQWEFSHVYPVIDPKPHDHGMKSITWNVSANTDGTLVEKGSDLELSYLFWEATSDSSIADSPPLTPIDTDAYHVEDFNPAFPVLDPDMPTSVLLPFDELLPYLDDALKSLSLHTSARNDFITYWLPSLSRRPYVALRFLPQVAYERAQQSYMSSPGQTS